MTPKRKWLEACARAPNDHKLPQQCAAPSSGAFEYKARDYAFTADGRANVTLENMAFKGATLQLSDCVNCTLSNLTLRFPTYDREVRELNEPKGEVARTTVGGTGIRAANITLTQSNNNGLVLVGDDTAETFIGMEGNDVIFAGGGADNALGNEGDDMIFGDGGADRLFGGEGDDVIEAGKGRDMVFADDGDDTVIATEDDGADSYWGGEGSDTLDYAAIQASVEVDLGHGTNGHGQVMIGETADQIYSFENVITGSGDDTIIANSAVNVMDGGGGHDTFVFNSAADADGDRINGFAPGDKIDLSGIDADQGAAGSQSFVLFAAGDFSAAGELRVSYEMRDDGEHTIVAGNVDDDLDADFEIDIAGRHMLDASDFNGVN